MIVYTPIDIACKVPDRQQLTDYVLNNYMTNVPETTGYNSLLCAIASRNDVTDWRDATQIFVEDDFQNLNKNTQLKYAPGVMPELKEILEALPFREIIGAGLNLQTNVLPAHRDEILDLSNPMSPERYNVLLTPHYGIESFFLAKTLDSEKDYPTILEDYPIYAFNNKDFYHGADPVLDNRIIMICAGLIDHTRHEELIKRSSEKFKDYVIRY
jgi:hypothetical protein